MSNFYITQLPKGFVEIDGKIYWPVPSEQVHSQNDYDLALKVTTFDRGDEIHYFRFVKNAKTDEEKAADRYNV